MTPPGSAALAALCACFIAISAAAAPADSPAAEQGTGPDQASAALLAKVVGQIVAGRTVSPLDDNALGTWEEVRKRANEPTPAIARALEDFVKLSESRAAAEHSAGREMIAFDLQAFAGMAQELLQTAMARSPAPDRQSGAEPAAPATAAPATTTEVAPIPVEPAAAPAKPEGGDAVLAPAAPVAPPAAEPAAAPIKPPADATVALATPTQRPPPQQSSPEQERMAATFTSRGDAMLAIKDISAARKLYEQAANLGSAAAAKGLARTYDPAYVGKLSIMGMRPDLAMAASWYDRAAALGDREAAQRMHELEAMQGTAPQAKTTP
jgi:hypothetical protein